jgi:uncharacterized protein (DUF2062 family)
MVCFLPNSLGARVSAWLRQGISPRRLALTLALGFAIGCIPLVGLPTLLCAALAMALKLNLPAIQAANYVVTPLQLLLIAPFVRLGGWLAGYMWRILPNADRFVHLEALGAGAKLISLASQALFAWMLVAIPAVTLITLTLTPMFRRIPVVSSMEAGD